MHQPANHPIQVPEASPCPQLLGLCDDVPSYSTVDNNSPVAVNINVVKIEPNYLPGHAIPSHANRFGAAMDLTELYYEMAMADTPHMQGIMLMARSCASFWSAASGGRSIVLIRKRVELGAQLSRPRISSLRRSIWQRGSVTLHDS
jgi:hypothetical protein